MTAITQPDPALTSRLEAARAEAGQPLSREEVADIIREVIGTMEGDISALDLQVYNELEALARYIQSARVEIAAIRPDEIREDHIPKATDELDAVVGATEDATGRILDAAEQIQTIAEGLDQPAQGQLIDLVTGIFEACNFQDITGQRISKVVRTLKHIETKIDVLIQALGEEVERAKIHSEANREPKPASDEDLLNGPQLPAAANGQDEIDRLLAGLD
jgi:chemotaxis protein CheZ